MFSKLTGIKQLAVNFQSWMLSSADRKPKFCKCGVC